MIGLTSIIFVYFLALCSISWNMKSTSFLYNQYIQFHRADFLMLLKFISLNCATSGTSSTIFGWCHYTSGSLLEYHQNVNILISLQWRDGVSNHQPHDCSLNRLFRCRSKETPKLLVPGLYAGNSPVTGEFPALRTSNAENISIWWRHM